MMGIFREITEERTENDRQLVFRHPWINLAYNWIIAILIILIGIACIKWSLDIREAKKEAAITASARASWEAEQQAKEEERLQALKAQEESEEYSLKRMATALAKVYFGADKFRDKYGYGTADFNTLGRCVTNRVENRAFSNDFYEVINQKDQWVGYYDSNPVLDDYYEIAYQFLKSWLHEEIKPVSNEYCWAEFTPNGIWLKSDFHADGYSRRWRDG